MSTVMQEYGLNSSCYCFLTQLAGNEGITQRKLCLSLAIDDAMATRNMRSLVKKGYVNRLRDENDSRSYKVYLTDKGREIVPLIREQLVNWWNKRLKDCNLDDIECLNNTMLHIVDNISVGNMENN